MDTLILIPTYNNAGTLANVLERALSQGLPVLVVDDGSTDGTAALLNNALATVRTPNTPFPCPDKPETDARTPNTPIPCPDKPETDARTPNTPFPCPDKSKTDARTPNTPIPCPDKPETDARTPNTPFPCPDKPNTDARTPNTPLLCPDKPETDVRTPNTPLLCPDEPETDARTPNTPIPCPDGAENALFVVHHAINQGKGRALKTGFEWARKQGFEYVITLDSDGQHFPEDIPTLVAAKAPRTLVVGSRNIQAHGMAGSSTFANKFSNFWFTLYTWNQLPDTQTGYRLYPLNDLPSLGLLSARYEAELTLLVFSAWKGLKLVPVPVKVDYPENRVTHFRPGKDFARISVLNTLLLFVALFYGYPRMLLSKLLR